MDYPASVRRAQSLALVATFSGVILGSNLVLTDLLNVKLLDSLVFVAAFLYGFRIGTSVAVVSELAWSFISPYGIAGYVTPFLVIGEMMFALAGWGASKLWSGYLRPRPAKSLFFGALLATCAFIWDLETNVGTALIAFWPQLTIQNVLLTELQGVSFMLFHELSDLVLGVFFVPAVIFLLPRLPKNVS